MFSDDWHRENCRFENRTEVLSPVYYRHVFDKHGDLVGVIVDYEYADDFHYEIPADDWKAFCRKQFGIGNEREEFRAFLERNGLDTEEGKFTFELAMKAAGTRFNIIAFY